MGEDLFEIGGRRDAAAEKDVEAFEAAEGLQEFTDRRVGGSRVFEREIFNRRMSSFGSPTAAMERDSRSGF